MATSSFLCSLDHGPGPGTPAIIGKSAPTGLARSPLEIATSQVTSRTSARHEEVVHEFTPLKTREARFQGSLVGRSQCGAGLSS